MFVPPAAVPLPFAPPPPLAFQLPAALADKLPPLWLVILIAAAGLAIGLLLNAIFLRLAASLIVRETIPFGDACVTILLAGLANAALTFVLGLGAGFVVGAAGLPEILGLLASLLTLPAALAVLAWLISVRHDLPFGQAALVTLLMIVLEIAAGVLIGLAVAMIVVAAAALLG